jgi:hypothetical protein
MVKCGVIFRYGLNYFYIIKTSVGLILFSPIGLSVSLPDSVFSSIYLMKVLQGYAFILSATCYMPRQSRP